MQKLPVLVFSLLLPAIAFAQAGPPPPQPDEAQDVDTAHPPEAQPDVNPPAPPAAPPSRAQSSDDEQAGILQHPFGNGPGILQGSDDDADRQQGAVAPSPQAAAPRPTGQWVYTHQYGWVWMPYGRQYVDEGTYGADSPYEYVYSVSIGWSWVAAPWLWGWGAYPYFGVWGPSHFSWYRGLYRSGYGWGHYRGGYPRGGGGYKATRPIAGGSVSRGAARFSGGARIQGGSRTYGGSPARGGSFHGGGRSGSGAARSGSGPHAGGGSRGGGGHGRR